VALKTYDVRSRLQTESSPRLSTFVFGVGRQHLPSICGATGANYAGAGYASDGLSRKITVTEADTSVTSYKDQGDSTSHTYQTLEIDTVQVNRLNYADAAGRLKEVDKNCTSCFSGTYGIAGQATYHTTYGYDVLDDLMTVTQAEPGERHGQVQLRRQQQSIHA
jgi:hypothetical protein